LAWCPAIREIAADYLEFAPNTVKFTSRDCYVYVKLRRSKQLRNWKCATPALALILIFALGFERFRQAESR
jgi:hypothetical protein